MNKKSSLFFLMIVFCASLYAAEPEAPTGPRELPEGAGGVLGPRERFLAKKDATFKAAEDALDALAESMESGDEAFGKLENASRVLATWCLRFACFFEAKEVTNLKSRLEVRRDTDRRYMANRLWRRALFAMEQGAWFKLFKTMPVGEDGRISYFQLQQLLTWPLGQMSSFYRAFECALELRDFGEAKTNLILVSMICDFVKKVVPSVGAIPWEGRETMSDYFERMLERIQVGYMVAMSRAGVEI